MKKLWTLVGLGVALVLTGATSECSLDPNIATPNQVMLAANTFNAGQVTLTNYLKLPLCTVNGQVLCRTQALSQSAYSALKNGRAARSTLLADLAAGQPAPITLYQTLQAAYAVVQTIQAQ